MIEYRIHLVVWVKITEATFFQRRFGPFLEAPVKKFDHRNKERN